MARAPAASRGQGDLAWYGGAEVKLGGVTLRGLGEVKLCRVTLHDLVGGGHLAQSEAEAYDRPVKKKIKIKNRSGQKVV